MLSRTRPDWTLRVLLALALALSLGAVALVAPVSPTAAGVSALDDDDDDGGDDDDDSGGGDLDEDDDDDDSGDDDDGDDNSGQGNGDDDDEGDFATAAPTDTTEPDGDPTQSALTPVSSPTRAATPPVSTGTLVISLRDCPATADPADGIDALRDACPDGRADADFELAGRSGIFNGWSREVTTDDDGEARVDDLAEGTYSLTLDELDWCAAEASSVNDGLILIAPGETTEVTAYPCPDAGTPPAK